MHEVAEELVALYRRRLQVTGHAFAPDTPWQAELESSFPFVETTDQLRAIEEVKADMELPHPWTGWSVAMWGSARRRWP